MTQTQEFTGKDIDKAIQKACKQLVLSRDELKYDVISQGSTGIFGIVGRKDAKIKVTLPAVDDSGEMDGIQSMVDEAFGQDTRSEETKREDAKREEKKREESRREKSRPQKQAKKNGKPKSFKEPKESVKKPRTSHQPNKANEADKTNHPENAGKSNKEDQPNNENQTDEVVTGEVVDGEEKRAFVTPEPVDVSEESIALGIEALQRMADLITEDTVVSAETEKDRLTLKIDGGNAGILIGRKGQTLDAMQFLTDKIINRKSEARVRVKVDIEGYMETRKSNLKHLAFKMADKAKKTGRPATINQMSAQDRRIVHLALKDDNKVRTQSMGDGYYRRLVIFPKKKNSFRGKKRLKK